MSLVLIPVNMTISTEQLANNPKQRNHNLLYKLIKYNNTPINKKLLNRMVTVCEVILENNQMAMPNINIPKKFLIISIHKPLLGSHLPAETPIINNGIPIPIPIANNALAPNTLSPVSAIYINTPTSGAVTQGEIINVDIAPIKNAPEYDLPCCIRFQLAIRCCQRRGSCKS